MIAGNRDGIPLVALDIDGTLGDYHGHFLAFAENWFGREFPKPHEINPGLRLSEFMGVPHEQYQRCKLAYRQGGLKRWMPAYEGVHRLTQQLEALGVDIWICTTRPFQRLDNVDPDTQEWLRRNKVLYHGLLFGDDKYHELNRQTRGRRTVLGVFDDLPELCEEARKYNWPVFVRDQPYNKHYHQAPRVYNCAEILERIKQQLLWGRTTV